MRLTLAAASLTLASVLGIGSMSAQGQGTPSAPVPGQPTQPGQPTRPGQPTQPGQGTTPSQPRPEAPSQPTADREVTLTGCVGRDATKPAAGGQATAGFVLTNVRAVTSAGADSRGAAQAAQAPGRMADLTHQYRLMAKGDVNFSPHLNHQVRVTGTTMDAGISNRGNTAATGSNTTGSTGYGSTATGSTATGSTPTGSITTPAPIFHVTQLTMVSATCDTK